MCIAKLKVSIFEFNVKQPRQCALLGMTAILLQKLFANWVLQFIASQISVLILKYFFALHISENTYDMSQIKHDLL